MIDPLSFLLQSEFAPYFNPILTYNFWLRYYYFPREIYIQKRLSEMMKEYNTIINVNRKDNEIHKGKSFILPI